MKSSTSDYLDLISKIESDLKRSRDELIETPPSQTATDRLVVRTAILELSYRLSEVVRILKYKIEDDAK